MVCSVFLRVKVIAVPSADQGAAPSTYQPRSLVRRRERRLLRSVTMSQLRAFA
ncbi:MAG TPA: hypothetical protein VE596_15375 [Gaiellaceae bacterium]|nr:hypothetical protein [Gaiellaceae bacterium]